MYKDIIIKRLERLEESIRRLKSKMNISLEEFKSSWELQDIILKEFETGIECIIDIGSHIISEKGWRTPEKASDIPDILEEKGIITFEYKDILKKIIAFRNLIVHEYLYIDLEKAYENLNRVDELKKFAVFIERFLSKE
ncbi:MAG: DUF86 domain-containing protein [Candidatus Omnitrophica bacterium]|nr:DUF86 domain-containing protein [Candidatus Omnitrophota bacterium]MCM8778145.1 DUF86 domain-containing protein [Candidatus Omnitrophota bacterium]